MLITLLTILTTILILLYGSWIVLFLLPNKKTKVDFLYKPLSIIIPAHNEEKSIGSTIKSVLAADYPEEKEIIVVNDGSTDRTEEIVKSIAKENKNVRLIQGLHQGKGKAVNLAVKHSKHDFIAVLDADTEIEKDSLIHLLQGFSDKSVGATSSVLRVKKSHWNVLNWFQQLEYPSNNAWRYVVDKINGTCVAPGFCAFRKDLFLSIGGFHSDCATEDYDICVRIHKTGHKIKMASKAIAYTEVPGTVLGFIKQRARWGRGTFQVIKKHKDILFKRNPVGLYSLPNQLYWFVHAFLYVPVILYQIIEGYFRYFYSVGEFLSYNVFMYFFKWFTIFGMGDFMYKIFSGVYPYTTLNILTIIVFLLSYTFSIISLIKFSKKSTYQILFAVVFFFPYSISMLSINIYSVFYEVFSLGRGEKWEKIR